MRPIDFMKEARRYRREGLSVLPLLEGEKKPASHHGVKDASDDPDTHAAWAASGGLNIGIACGKVSGITVLDIDGPIGLANVQALALGEVMNRTPCARTANGGYHLFFEYHPDVMNTVSKICQNVDTRNDHGYVVSAPSTLATGGAYEWLRPIDRRMLRPMPEQLVKLAQRRPDSVPAPPPCAPTTADESRVLAALKAVSASCDRDTWIAIGQSLHSHFGDGAGWSIWDNWSRTAPDAYDHWAARSAWRSFKPGGGRNLSTVFGIAKDHGANISEICRQFPS